MSTKNKSYDKKIFRLFYILNRLDTSKDVTTRELSEEFDVTYRTVQRDLQLLNITGFPIVTSEKGHHSFLEGFSLKKMLLTKEESIGEKSKIALHYRTDKKEGDYKVRPLKIVFYDGFWYLLSQVDNTDKLLLRPLLKLPSDHFGHIDIFRNSLKMQLQSD